MGYCSWGLKNEFETAVVNEPSVFEPLKFYCIYNQSTIFVPRIWSKAHDVFRPLPYDIT